MRDRNSPIPGEAQRRRAAAAFACMTCLIAVVSVHDAMLVVLNRAIIAEVEQNPLGRWLIELQEGDVWLFISAKLCGTALVCAVLITLYRLRQNIALAVAGALACFQLALLAFLSMK